MNSSMVVRQSTRSMPSHSGQRLGVAQHVPDRAAHHQALAQRRCGKRAPMAAEGRRAHHRPAGQQVPRALAGVGVGRVLLVDRQFVADRAGGDHTRARSDLDQGD